MAEDKARDRRESLDSGRERNAVIRSQGPDGARMGFFNGLPGRLPGASHSGYVGRPPTQSSHEATKTQRENRNLQLLRFAILSKYRLPWRSSRFM